MKTWVHNEMTVSKNRWDRYRLQHKKMDKFLTVRQRSRLRNVCGPLFCWHCTRDRSC